MIHPIYVALSFLFSQLKATNLMEELDVHDYLVFKKDGDNGPMILIGGLADALIIHATKVQKASEGLSSSQFKI